MPDWLIQHTDSFKRAMVSGNRVANVILSVLERNLQLPAGSFTDLHRLTDSSGDFLRVLRYPAAEADDETPDNARFPAHKDAVSIAMLFTWVGGLQIADPEADRKAQGAPVPEESWRWVKPIPGHAIVNLGEAMEIFSNQVLLSGLHRVVKAPGQQAAHDKYSVLLVVRPKDDTLMRPFKSPAIPENEVDAGNEEKVMTSIEWGNGKIRRLQDHIDKTFTERSGKAFALDRSWKQ
jgi:isopenicillin N synthase-like dioxygenase